MFHKTGYQKWCTSKACMLLELRKYEKPANLRSTYKQFAKKTRTKKNVWLSLLTLALNWKAYFKVKECMSTIKQFHCNFTVYLYFLRMTEQKLRKFALQNAVNCAS